MRTMITIDDALYSEVEALAKQRNCSVDEVINSAMKVHLRHLSTSRVDELPPLPRRMSGGPHPGININDTSSLMSILDEGQELNSLR
jgi:hypothetical protein